MQMRSELISKAKLDTLRHLHDPIFNYLRKTFYFLVSRRNIELKNANMNSLIQVIKINMALKAKSSAGRNSPRLKRILCQTLPTRGIEGKDTY